MNLQTEKPGSHNRGTRPTPRINNNPSSINMLSEHEVCEGFRQAMVDFGIPTNDEIIADGNLHGDDVKPFEAKLENVSDGRSIWTTRSIEDSTYTKD